MRVCLVSSVNLSSWYSHDCEPAILSLPLGLLSLAAVLEESGHEVSLVDLNYALSEGELALDEDFYAASVAQIVGQSPQVVGFSTMCNSFHIALRMAEAIKAQMPRVLVLLGGPQVSVADVETLCAFPFVDLVLRGEAEQTLPRLMSALAEGQMPTQLPGLTYRTNGRVVRNPDVPLVRDLDGLPVPAYHLFPYSMHGAAAVDVGRGCPFACSFCSTSTFWRRQARNKSTERIIKEMWMLKRQYEVTRFTFMHDLFTLNKRRLRDFCDRLQEEKMDISWSCSARVDCVDAQLLRRMADSGCAAVFYGVETGSPRHAARDQQESGARSRMVDR